eukprot:g2838.t1
MGRRKKSSKKVIKKKKPGVATVFKCLYCGHEKCVECNLELGKGIGSLKCRVCGASFQMRINYLTEPVDVFCEWLDAHEAEAEGGSGETHDGGGDIGAEQDQADESVLAYDD